jgi:hypothetical protein
MTDEVRPIKVNAENQITNIVTTTGKRRRRRERKRRNRKGWLG